MTNIHNKLNKTILFNFGGRVIEGKVIEVDPTGTVFKVINNGNGAEEWYKISTVEFLSTLDDRINETHSLGGQLING